MEGNQEEAKHWRRVERPPERKKDNSRRNKAAQKHGASLVFYEDTYEGIKYKIFENKRLN